MHGTGPDKRLAAAFLALFVLCGFLFSDTAWCASTGQMFNKAWNDFHSLTKDSKRSRYRSHWLELERQFQDIYRKDPKGSYAPKSLYYIGRVNEELGKRSGLKSDLKRANEYYQRVVSRFPSHSWSDDCLYRKANISLDYLHEPDQAYADLLLIVHNYPKGDMNAKAKAELAELDRSNASVASASKPSAPSPAPAPSPARTSIPTSGSSTAVTKKNSGKAHLQEVRYRSSDDYTRVVLDLDEEVPFKWQLLNPNHKAGLPHRVYVDLSGTRLASGVAPTLNISDGILSRIRTGQNTHDTARVVLDFNNLQDYKVFHLYDPFRVVIDVYAPNKTARATAPLPPAGSRPAPSESVKPSKDSKQYAGDLIEQLGLSVNTIMIDAGHGGKDPGAMANGIKEKDLTLRMAKILGKKLQAQGFKVIYTREDDTFIPLEERTAMANVRKADLFISLHCNAHKKTSVHGMETYVLNLARSQDAVRVAARENAVSEKRISDLQVILTDLMLSSKVRESRDLAGVVQKESVTNIRRKYSLKDRNVHEAPFYVLMGAKMPAVLVEAGYITNSSEAKRLKTNDYLNRLCDGIVTGVLAYKRQIERYASL